MTMRYLAVLAVACFLGSLLPSSHGYPEEFALCEDAAALKPTCDENRRYCVVNTTDSLEFCGPCVNGTIEDFTAPPEEEFPLCILIEEITIENFKKAFGDAIEAGDEELATRIVIIFAAAAYVSKHNSEWPPPEFVLKLNEYSLLTQAEIEKRNGLNSADAASAEEGFPLMDLPEGERLLQDLPLKVDWVEEGAVTRVVDQGQCGCCWAISVAGALEGSAYVTSNGDYMDELSFQQMISCDKEQFGCNGGNVITALEYTKDNDFGGLTTAAAYPYTDKQGQTTEVCKKDSSTPLAVRVPELGLAVSSTSPLDVNERVLRIKHVLTYQPIIVLMNANCPLINNYGSGIITDDADCACNDVDCINHAVLMVGYDDTSNPPSFKVKNSWGTGWGEDGYFRVSQTVDADTMRYGLFGLLWQGSAGLDVVNATAAIPGSAASVTAGSSFMWIAAAVSSAAALFSAL